MIFRQSPQVNAGSMADIAFLLLVFFLLVTNIEIEKGVLKKLPDPDDEVRAIPVPERNILRITILKDGKLNVEDQIVDLQSLSKAVNQFYTNGGVYHNSPAVNFLPSRKPLRLDSLQSLLVELRQIDAPESQIKAVNRRIDALQLIGQFRAMPPSAAIYVEMHDSVSYSRYIEVMDEVNIVLASLRNELCQSRFNREYNALDEKVLADRKIIRAARTVYPDRWVEAIQ